MLKRHTSQTHYECKFQASFILQLQLECSATGRVLLHHTHELSQNMHLKELHGACVRDPIAQLYNA